MSKDYVKARCNMFGVLANMEYLLDNDPDAGKMVQGKNLAVQFNVRGGIQGNLSFQNGKATMKEGKHKSSINLYFSDPKKFNLMMEGKANPLPTKGFTKLGFLTGTFPKLADRLETYMRPEPKALKDRSVFKANTEMTALAAFFALSEIANYDDRGKSSAAHIPDGVILLEIKDELSLHIRVESGRLTTLKGSHDDPRAILSFKDLETAHAILNGSLDTYTAIAMGDMEMRGFIPMIEHLNPILSLVGTYLQ